MLLAKFPGSIRFQPAQADQNPGEVFIGEAVTQFPGLLGIYAPKALEQFPRILVLVPLLAKLPGALGIHSSHAHQHLGSRRVSDLVADFPGVLGIAAANGQGNLPGDHIRQLETKLTGPRVLSHPGEAAGDIDGNLSLELFAKVHSLLGAQAAKTLRHQARLAILDLLTQGVSLGSSKAGAEERRKSRRIFTEPVEV